MPHKLFNIWNDISAKSLRIWRLKMWRCRWPMPSMRLMSVSLDSKQCQHTWSEKQFHSTARASKLAEYLIFFSAYSWCKMRICPIWSAVSFSSGTGTATAMPVSSFLADVDGCDSDAFTSLRSEDCNATTCMARKNRNMKWNNCTAKANVTVTDRIVAVWTRYATATPLVASGGACGSGGGCTSPILPKETETYYKLWHESELQWKKYSWT